MSLPIRRAMLALLAAVVASVPHEAAPAAPRLNATSRRGALGPGAATPPAADPHFQASWTTDKTRCGRPSSGQRELGTRAVLHRTGDAPGSLRPGARVRARDRHERPPRSETSTTS